MKNYKRGVKGLGKQEFLDILDFYLFNCPVKFNESNKVSVLGKSFDELGVNLKKLYKQIEKTNVKIIVVKSIENSNNTYNSKINIICLKGTKNKKEKKKNKDLIVKDKTQRIFYAIRCALAHGNFKFERNHLMGTNVYRKDIKATFNLHYNILMEWIGLVNDLINNK